MSNPKPLFLLGGHDLEMCTIKDMLLEAKVVCFDASLQWNNAYVSAYQKELEQYGADDSEWTIYGVELQEDIPLPYNYKAIDHHNLNMDLPSALEQVADLLGVPLNRRMQLIAANDKGYIPGMQALQASDAEIMEIRRADRACQGVTEEDELLAEKAIKENRLIEGDLTIVQALSHKFSPVCDRLFPYDRLLVYTDEEWMYYGKQAGRLRDFFHTEILEGRLFYGGGINGYIGAKVQAYTGMKIRQHVEKIRNLIRNGNI